MTDPIHRQHPDPAARTYRPDPVRDYPLAPPPEFFDRHPDNYQIGTS